MANIITTLALEMSANWYVSKKLNSVGRVGENTVTKLTIEPTEILDATYEIEIMSADGSKNVAELTVDGTELYLILTANMLTTSGITKMQVRAVFSDGSIKKSNIFELKVNRSISATDYYEEYSVTIFDQLVQDCRDIIEGAESYVVRAETAAVNAEAYSEAASASANNASASATAASTSAANAAISETNASTSAANASTSETNAASSETSAANSATSASTSATNAANSATAAATSASNAAVSATNASASETNASTSATEAAEAAETVASSIAQINENTYRINDLEAIIGGYTLADLPTGAVASITDGTALLMPSLKIGIEPAQDLHGYDHPWTGGAGKNKLQNVRSTTTINGITFTVNNDGSVFIAGNQTASDLSVLNLIANNLNYYNLTDFGLSYDTDYIISGCPNGGTASSYRLVFRSGGAAANYIDNGSGVNFNIGSESNTLVWMPCIMINSGYTIPSGGLLFKPMIRLATETDPTYEPYSNICPISGWTEANVNVSPTTSAEDGTTYTIEFRDGDNPLTVYGGELDVVNGVLKITDGYITSYNTETLPSTWISDRDVYAEGATPTTGAEVVYTLETALTYHLTPTQVRTLVGNNNIWADTGDIVEGKYYRSLT